MTTRWFWEKWDKWAKMRQNKTQWDVMAGADDGWEIHLALQIVLSAFPSLPSVLPLASGGIIIRTDTRLVNCINIFVYFLLDLLVELGWCLNLSIQRMGTRVLFRAIFIIWDTIEHHRADGQTTDLKSSGHKTTGRGRGGGGGGAGK